MKSYQAPMKKIYLEIGSSVGLVIMFILSLVIINTKFVANAAYGNVALLLVFVIIAGIIGLKLSEIPD
ncbi:MAG: hypothetical protein SCH39_00695 [Methanosarcinales archaeon]|nr:hypothetical protein [ANME-2 cluster archaeon]MDF1531198.1 hypothetical protein [ANME-2 cluster archaeon]MDW7774836.1 hypothetical protein [Methanosarcinales archaeon]